MSHNYILYEMNFSEQEYDFVIVGARCIFVNWLSEGIGTYNSTFYCHYYLANICGF